MQYDAKGNPVIFVIYDRSKTRHTGQWWRVAHFKYETNAQAFLEEQQNEALVISCQSPRQRDYSLLRD